jgi:aryl-alcohol dehydrogenase-like predicted oxidoreductase
VVIILRNVLGTELVYGFGRSEEIAGETIVRRGCRDRFTIVAKIGLEWQEENR